MREQEVTLRLLSGFDDPSFDCETWNRLLDDGDTNVVFLTHEWQHAWWGSFGRGRLMVILAERAGRPLALAPLFADSGMIYFVGSGGSDYLDFIGDVSHESTLDLLLTTAIGLVPEFLGFVFYHIPADSRTGNLLQQAGKRLGLRSFDEGEIEAPTMVLGDKGETALAAASKKSLVRKEKSLRKDGRLDIEHIRDEKAVEPWLEVFFRQHIERWNDTDYPSLFLDRWQQAFYYRLAEALGKSGWLRFTVLSWNDEPIAFHFGMSYAGRYLWYKPAFAIDLGRRSPGQVLLRQLLLAAVEEGVSEFDFGLGDEPFKKRFATEVKYVRSWGLYPPERSASRSPVESQ